MQYPEYEDLLADARPSGLDTAANPPHLVGDDLNLEAFLTDAQKQERKRIKTALDQVERELQHRTQIYEEAVAELEDALQDEVDRLERLQRPSIPADRILHQKRQVRGCEQQLHDQRRSHWQDREQLERERRRLQRELSELQDTDLSALF